MLFRDTAGEAHSSGEADELSSSEESLTSCQSYATQSFEERMRLLMADRAIDDGEVNGGGSIWRCGGVKTEALGEWPLDDLGIGLNVFDEAFDGGTQIPCLDCDDGTEWKPLTKTVVGPGVAAAQFHAYPPSEYFKASPQSQSRTPDGGGSANSSHHGTKMFIGGLRFEVVQAGRQLISWIFEMACGVQVPLTSILIHRKSKGGRNGSPTGCASIFVTNEDDVERLLSMSQRIYCSAKGVYVTASTSHMAELFERKAFVEIAEGRKRGPSHPIVIERAYGAAGHPSARNSTATSANSVSVRSTPTSLPLLSPCGVPRDLQSPSDCSMTAFSSVASSLHSNASLSTGTTGAMCPSTSEGPQQTPGQGKSPQYIRYPGEAEARELLRHIPMDLQNPAGVFLGGLPAEASTLFVAWFFSLINVHVHPDNVSLGADSHFGEKSDCASVRLEEVDVSKATKWTKRVLCDVGGVWFADSHRTLLSLQASRDKADPPARPLFIKRRDMGRGVPNTTSGSNVLGTSPATTAASPALTVDNSILPPPPLGLSPLPLGQPARPPPLPVAWEGPSPEAVGGAQVPPLMESVCMCQRPPPPPYIQNVIIGDQSYQLPVGASIQLQLVPVITAPGIVPTPVQPLYQTVVPTLSPQTLQ
uniref:Uncharacterized protein n=1 Tax=Trypanosoma congolense (strain IL3000) TaxID=1068625 RepID=G0UZQ3_TRYCI|nr:conserved hypothetical protein [Trypanosoma congolense IL3000]